MRDLELMNVVSLIHIAKTWKIPLYLGGDWNGHIGSNHGGDNIHIGPFTSPTPPSPKGFVFAHTFVNEDFIFGRQLSFIGQERIFMINTRKITETQKKQLDRGA